MDRWWIIYKKCHQYNLFNDCKLVFHLKLQASQLDPFKLETESPAKRILWKAALSALRDTWSTKKLSVSGNDYGAWGATSVNNTWGHTELAGPCVIGPSQVLTSSTEKGDSEHEYVSVCGLRSTEGHFTALWPCSGFADFFFFFLVVLYGPICFRCACGLGSHTRPSARVPFSHDQWRFRGEILP